MIGERDVIQIVVGVVHVEGSEAAALGYAAVYPLSMLVPVVTAQLLVTVMMR